MSTEVRPRGTGPLSNRERSIIPNRPSPPIATSLADEVLARKKAVPAAIYSPRKMSSAEFNTAMVHFYRGEIQRANVWRNRLDTTTNWAVLTAGAIHGVGPRSSRWTSWVACALVETGSVTGVGTRVEKSRLKKKMSKLR